MQMQRYKYEDERCPRSMCYKAYGSGKEDAPVCDVPGFENSRMKLLRHVSFVDCPVLLSLNGIDDDKVRLLSKAEFILSSRKSVMWDVQFFNIQISIPWENAESVPYKMVIYCRTPRVVDFYQGIEDYHLSEEKQGRKPYSVLN